MYLHMLRTCYVGMDYIMWKHVINDISFFCTYFTGMFLLTCIP